MGYCGLEPRASALSAAKNNPTNSPLITIPYPRTGLQTARNAVLFAYGFSFTHPLAPPLKQVCLWCSSSIRLERGKELERGLHPLSSILPSPAIKGCGHLPVILVGEGSGVRRKLPTKGK